MYELRRVIQSAPNSGLCSANRTTVNRTIVVTTLICLMIRHLHQHATESPLSLVKHVPAAVRPEDSESYMLNSCCYCMNTLIGESSGSR